MTRLEKCEMAKSLGYVYNPDSGLVHNKFGKKIGYLHKNGYIVLSTTGKFSALQVHHFAWYFIYGNVDFEQLDHINRIRTDNRISNLRIVNRQQNMFNKKAKGYTWDKRSKKYQTQIMINGKNICGGLFNTEEEARNRYLELKEIYHIID